MRPQNLRLVVLACDLEVLGVGDGRLMQVNWRELAKCFVHGIAFSVLGTLLLLFGLVVALMLVVIGSFIGLILGFALLILIFGVVNSAITEFLWFEVNWGFWNLLLHGFTLFIVLLAVNGVLVYLPLLFLPGLATTTVTFIIGCFADGFVGRQIAGWWEGESESEASEQLETDWKDRNL
jgi:hypothetical protein